LNYYPMGGGVWDIMPMMTSYLMDWINRYV
jgi:hypothetical protein